MDSRLRQGHPGLIPKEDLGRMLLRTLEWRRPWLEGWVSLLRWVPLPVPMEAEEAGGRGKER